MAKSLNKTIVVTNNYLSPKYLAEILQYNNVTGISHFYNFQKYTNTLNIESDFDL